MMTRRSQLQRTLNSLAAADTRAHMLREKLSSHCEEKYGFDPADIDFDSFIDACDGGAGACEGMSVEEFEYGMLNDGKSLPKGEG